MNANAPTLLERLRKRRVPPTPGRAVLLGGGGDALGYSAPDARLVDASFDEATASAEFVISTTRRDHHGDVVLSKGCLESLADYAANPRIFLNHASEALPIASARDKQGGLALVVEERVIRSRAFFHLLTLDSEEVCKLVAARELQGASIGFLPLEGEILEAPQDPHAGPEEAPFAQDGFVFSKWALLEWSVVGIPANADAIRGWLDATRGHKRLRSAAVRKSLEPFAAPRRATLFLPGSKPFMSSNPITKQDFSTPPTHAEPQDPLAGQQPAGGGDGSEESQAPVQCLLFDCAKFVGEAEVRAWLQASEYGDLTQDLAVSPGDGGENPHAVVLFDAASCEAGTEARKPLGEGVEAVTCTKTEGPVPQQPEADPTASNPNQPGSNPSAASHRAAPASVAKAMPDEEHVLGEEPPVSAGEDPPEGEEELKPYGASLLHKIYGCMEEMHGHMSKGLQVLEHPQTHKFVSRAKGALHKMRCDLHEFGTKTYPDHFKDVEAPKDDEEGDGKEDKVEPKEDEGMGPDEETDSVSGAEPYKRLRWRKGLAHKDVSVVSEAVEFLTELSEEDNLKKSQRAASRLHAASLKGLCEKHSAAAPAVPAAEPAKAAEPTPEELQLGQALEQLTRGQEVISDLFFSLTGKRV